MITAQKIVDMLNEVLAADPGALHALVEHRVLLPNPQPLVAHPAVVTYSETDNGPLYFGMLGILNGIAHMTGDLILAHYNDAGLLTKFSLKDRVLKEADGHP